MTAERLNVCLGSTGAYDVLLLSPQPSKVFTGLGVLLAFVVVVIAGGSFLFSKRDI